MLGGAARSVDGPKPVPAGERSSRPQPPRTPDTDAALQLRIGVHPFQMGRGWLGRTFDLGVGYAYDTGAAGRFHAAYLEGASFPSTFRFGAASIARFGVRGQIRLVYDPLTDLWGRGAALQFFGEVASFITVATTGTNDDPATTSTTTSSGRTSRCLLCIGYGEGAIGLYLEGSYARVGDVSVYTGGGGLTARVPSVLGLFSIP